MFFLIPLSCRLAAASLAAAPMAESLAAQADAIQAGGRASRPSSEAALTAGDAAYFRGEHALALEKYARAVRLSSASLRPWLSGAVVLEELGRTKEAVRWHLKASQLSAEPEVLSALGWAQWRAGDPRSAAETFRRALQREESHAYALLGLSRVELDAGRPREALELLDQASESAPLLNLIPYYQGRAYELLGDAERAEEAHRRAVAADSFFHEGRVDLARSYVRRRRFNEAWRQFMRLLEAEPRSRRFQALLDKARPLLTRRPAELRDRAPLPLPYLSDSEPDSGRRPKLRVGIGTNVMGRPRARQAVSFRVTSDFSVLDAATGKVLARGEANGAWQVRVKKIGKRRVLAVRDGSGKTVLPRASALRVRPASESGLLSLDEIPYPGAGLGVLTAGRLLRGELELAPAGPNLRVVNVVDLESYTHGVVGAEMPIQSPLEALKAQAVIARTHALYIQMVTRRHRRHGYDLCDDQHCQVYGGVRAESRRSRQVVEATRGVIAAYKGKPAHVIYFSNCGGRTQSGGEVSGWGEVPYWTGIADGPDLGAAPRSPWELKAWLKAWPKAYCKPSSYVHPSHFRWTRVIPHRDLEEKLDRRFRIGRLKTIRALRRAASGHVNSLLIEGSRRSARITAEMSLRGLLGIGSLRSTLFVVETEYGPDRGPARFVFLGGGWGHGVGLCQSGAMGRAEAGHGYEHILKSYFPGVEVGHLPR